MARPFAGSFIWRIIDWVGDATAIPERFVKPILSLSLFPSDISLRDIRPRLDNIHLVLFGHNTIDTAGWAEEEVEQDSNFRAFLMRMFEAMPKFNTHGDSLYYNAPIFIRLALPFFVGIQIRWSGATDKRAYVQAHVGWKLNGRFAIAFRIQSDKSAEEGMDFPNPGQAKGWEYGGK